MGVRARRTRFAALAAKAPGGGTRYHRPLLVLSLLAFGAPLAYACGDGTTQPEPYIPVATTITVSPATVELVVLGALVQLSAEVREQNGLVMAEATVTWTSSDGSVVTVDGSGLAMAVSQGTATITATSGDLSGTSEVTVTSPDRDALTALYHATDGPNWVDNTNWLTGAPLGEWYGVDTDAGGRVVELDLAGRFDDHRQQLMVHGLSGEIPPEIGQLVRLSSIYLSGNRLSGGIPSEIGELASLRTLFVENNQLTGPIPSSFLQLELDSLLLNRNRGLCIPGTSIFLSWLRAIELRDEQEALCNAADVAALKSIHESTGGEGWIRAAGWTGDGAAGEWEGVVADSLGRVVGLELAGNNLTGEMPAGVVALSRLEVLRIGENPLFGRLPLGLAGLPIRELHYAGTEVCVPAGESFSVWLAAVPSHQGTGIACSAAPSDREILEILYHATGGNDWSESANWLTEAPLGDWYGVETDESGRVVRLLLGSRRLFQSFGMRGRLPPEIGQLDKLSALGLWANELHGPIPPEIGDLAGLTSLWLYNTQLTGPIPPELGKLGNLRSLYLNDNELSGQIPPGLGDLSALRRLHLDFNQLSGAVPAGLSGMTSLRELTLGGNAEMKGELPLDLTQLRHLDVFIASGTGLCAPAEDLSFQTWLGGLSKRRIAACAEDARAAVHLTQAVQSFEHPVPLVAGRRALLRVFPTAVIANSADLPAVRARLYVNGGETHVIDIPGGPGPLPTAVDEGSLASSVNAAIPGDVIRPGLEMVIEVDPEGVLDPALGVARRIPGTGRLAVEVHRMPVFDLTVIPFVWSETHDSSIVAVVGAMAADPERHDLLSETRALLPVGELEVTAHEPVVSSSNSAFDLLLETRAIQKMEGGTGHYTGMMARPVTGGGVAFLPGRASFSQPLGATIAHQLGHNMNLQHAPCGGASGPDPAYPYRDGTIGAWGYDFEARALVNPSTPELMSFCGPRWISDYYFGASLRYRLEDEGSPGSAAAPVRSLLLWGGMRADSVSFLESAFVVDAPPSTPGVGGDHRLTGTAADGSVLFSFDFAMTEIADGEGRTSFAFLLPVDPAWESGLAALILTGPGGTVTMDGGTDQPMAILRDRATGQVRGFLRGQPAMASQVAAEAAGPAGAQRLEVLFSRGIPNIP